MFDPRDDRSWVAEGPPQPVPPPPPPPLSPSRPPHPAPTWLHRRTSASRLVLPLMLRSHFGHGGQPGSAVMGCGAQPNDGPQESAAAVPTPGAWRQCAAPKTMKWSTLPRPENNNEPADSSPAAAAPPMTLSPGVTIGPRLLPRRGVGAVAYRALPRAALRGAQPPRPPPGPTQTSGPRCQSRSGPRSSPNSGRPPTGIPTPTPGRTA